MGEGDDAGGFSYVTAQKKARRKRRGGKLEEATTLAARVERAATIVQDKRKILTEGKYGEELQQCLSTVLLSGDGEFPGASQICKIICLGLGPVRDSRSAQLQLALLGLLRETLQSGDRVVSVSAYDPIFDEDDLAILTAHNVASCADTEEDERLKAEHMTLFYMPHCERVLYERLWAVNESSHTKQNVLLLGNDHRLYTLSASDEKLAKEAPVMSKLLPNLTIREVPDAPKPFRDALQSQAFHWVAK